MIATNIRTSRRMRSTKRILSKTETPMMMTMTKSRRWSQPVTIFVGDKTFERK